MTVRKRSSDLKQNLKLLRTILGLSSDVVIREFSFGYDPIFREPSFLSMVWWIESNVDHGLHAAFYHPIFATPFLLLIPPLSLFIAKVRGFPRQTGDSK